ncbi:hypothetical protein MLD38_013210 [Melastoma candidum]|uniref:Uncharacterized protein n=1 Tax=Melastoma candidum TaxID=119954 RepID=A0ACB9R8G2_9MYRT|nr:hypothetical protein MLD38_013210 [Melastoma candidum]
MFAPLAMVLMLGIARPSFEHWFSLAQFFALLILVRPRYVVRPMMWKNALEGVHVYQFSSGSTVMLALYELGREQVIFGCGFHCSGIDCKIGSYTFSIFILQNPSVNEISINADVEPQVVWSANRDQMVGINATLELTSEGDLVVKDAGSVAWAARTSDRSVQTMYLTNSGNLMLLDGYNATIWQSSEHPTDTLLLGQVLRVGQKLTQRTSSANWTDGDMLSLSLTAEGLLASVESDSAPPLAYYSVNFPVTTQSYIEFVNGSINHLGNALTELPVLKFAPASSTQSVKLDPDGHLRLYEFQLKGAVEKADLFPLDACHYPTVCGHYGVCSNGTCRNIISPDRNKHFKRRDWKHRTQGFFPSLLTCVDTNNQTFLKIANVEYFNFVADLTDVDAETCKSVCMKNCSCTAVFYRVSPDKSRRWCFLPSEVFTLINGTGRIGTGINQTTAYIKLQRNSSDISSLPPSTETTLQKKELDSPKTENLHLSLATFVSAAMTSAILVVIFVLKKKKKRTTDVSSEKYVEQIPGLPTRFTYTELEEITENFSKKIGAGGFGSVYEGILIDKTKVDSAKRPSMSMVIKVLEGAATVPEDEINYEFKISSSMSLTMLRLAAQFLPVDSTKRPSISMAINVLEGVEETRKEKVACKFFSDEAGYNFRIPSLLMNGISGAMFGTNRAESAEVSGSRLSSEVLSGPR